MSSDGHSRRQRLASWFVALLPLSLDMSAWLLRKAARLPTHEAGDRRYWRERNNFTINHLNDDERLASHSIGPLAGIDAGLNSSTCRRFRRHGRIWEMSEAAPKEGS